jgi:aminocarboxymuconate-semialdehyde decarboxylase
MAENWNRYGATAARAPAKKPGRETRPKSVTIDIHAHIAVPEADKVVVPHIDFSRIPFARYSTPETKALNKSQDGDLIGRMTQYDERLRDLDNMGLDLQLVMCPPAQCYYTVPVEIAAKGTRIVNDGIAAYVAKKPDRFLGLGNVSLQDGEQAAKELEYCMKELRFKGVQVLTNVDGKELSDPVCAPFWKKAEELGAVVLLHPNGFTEAQRLAKHYFINVIGNPFDTTMALHYLIFDGVLERHPNLKIISVHGGGYLAAYSGRIDHAWGARSDVKGNLPKPPTSYLKKIYVDTVVFTAHQLKALIEVFGVDHVVLGTDYPYDMAEFDPIEHLVSSGLDASAIGGIAGGNAKKLLGL